MKMGQKVQHYKNQKQHKQYLLAKNIIISGPETDRNELLVAQYGVTSTDNNAEAVKNAKAGQVQYRTDKAGIIHATIGRASFAEADLRENFNALLDALIKAKPAAAKGQYLRKVAVSSTMGLGVRVDTSSVNN